MTWVQGRCLLSSWEVRFLCQPRGILRFESASFGVTGILKIADMLSSGIISQFPQKFAQ